jgi:Mn-dependent DtxR family transcriptional regulator
VLEPGPLRCGSITVEGACVNSGAVTYLEKLGLVERHGSMAELTAEGRQRVERRW